MMLVGLFYFHQFTSIHKSHHTFSSILSKCLIDKIYVIDVSSSSIGFFFFYY